MAELQASIVSVAHQERPEYLDRLSMLRNQVFVLDHMYMSVFATCGWILRLAAVVGPSPETSNVHQARTASAVSSAVRTGVSRPRFSRSVVPAYSVG